MTNDLGRSSARRHLMAWIGVGVLAVGSVGCLKPVEVAAPADDAMRARAARDVGIDHLTKGKLAMAIRQLQLSASLDDTDVETHLWLGEEKPSAESARAPSRTSGSPE